jgi:hypothetical protein
VLCFGEPGFYSKRGSLIRAVNWKDWVSLFSGLPGRRWSDGFCGVILSAKKENRSVLDVLGFHYSPWIARKCTFHGFPVMTRN